MYHPPAIEGGAVEDTVSGRSFRSDEGARQSSSVFEAQDTPAPDAIGRSPVRIEAAIQPAINAALWQNHVPILSELRVVNTTGSVFEELTLELRSEPAVIAARSWRLQGFGGGQARELQDLDLQLDGALLSGLTEATRGRVVLTATQGGEILAEASHDIRVLAANEWGGTAAIPDILAAFVQPNDPAVARIVRAASDLLKAAGHADTLEGYQSGKARVWEQAQAIWAAVCALDVRYINPPPSFVADGQRIRTPGQVLEERLATCLDLAVLFASCLECIGLRPLLVLQRGHAFPGVWLSKHDFGSSRIDDAPGLRTRLRLDDLILFEATLATSAHKPGFTKAIEAGDDHLKAEKDAEFDALIDIGRARQRRILPLPAAGKPDPSSPSGDSRAGPVGPPRLDPAPTLRPDDSHEPEAPPTTAEGRLARWRKRLLDLSGRNRLLNLPAGGKQAVWIDCPDIAALEDALAGMRGNARAAPLRFRPWPEVMEGADPRSAALHRDRLHDEAATLFARDAMGRGELLVGRDEAGLQTALTEVYRKARSDVQEGGANTLFLTLGTLYWRQKDREKPYRAPLILVPVVLDRPSVRSGFTLRVHDDETRINATLLEMLRQEFGIQFPALQGETLPEDGAGLDVARIIDIFRVKLRDIPGWEVRDEAALTTLTFTKFLMWKDLADRSEALRASEVARRLIDGATKPDGEKAPSGVERSHRAGSLDEQLERVDLVCPMEADSSQLDAAARAARGESFVLIGPPGTGKSQTIANIIADTLARGRTVLFVAEKQAALEVVQRRLKQVGLADFCLDLFSSKASKLAVLEQLDRAQSCADQPDTGGWEAAKAEIAALRQELNGYVRDLHRPGRNGWTPFRAIGEVLRAEDGAVPDIALTWPETDGHDAAAWRRMVEAVEEAAAILQRSAGIAASPALTGIERPEWSPLWQARLLEKVRTTSEALGALDGAAEAASAALGLKAYPRSRTAIAALADLAAALTNPLLPEAGWALAEEAAATRVAWRDAASQAARHRDLRAGLTGRWRAGATSLMLPRIRAEWFQAQARWAVPRAIAQRALRKVLAPQCEGALPVDCGPDLNRLAGMRDIEQTVAAAPCAGALGAAWHGLATDFERLERVFDLGQRLRRCAAACASDPAALIGLRSLVRQLAGEGADLLRPEGSVGRALTGFLAAFAACDTHLAELGPLCGSDAASLTPQDRDDWLGGMLARLEGWRVAAPRIQDWCAWRGAAQALGGQGLGPLAAALETGLVAPGDAVRALEANYARWWVNLAVDASPRLRRFVAATHETRVQRFRALDARMLGLAARLARARVASGIPAPAARAQNPEYGLLTHELAKRQRHLPVRQLAARMPQALRRLTPCLMMSPLSVAQYLPAEAEAFDLVIFDEASQITTWDAIGAVGRGRQVIVVGDPRQLPPTRFFERRADDSEGEGAPAELEDLESILDECLGAGIPAVELTWHYRSRHESLIAFSNHAFYGGRLVTFPSAVTTDRAVTLRHVRNGTYARGGARTNEREAHAVVAEVLAVLRSKEPRSVGIVTFNAEQQSLVEDLLDKARREDPALERFFADDVAEPVLVKNLEGVQGEERDVMLFSLTYGPDGGGRLSLNFGPLNSAGGERRLNVAVTRARERLVVFASFHADQLDLSRTNAVGIKRLKDFMRFAEHGARSFAVADQGSVGDHESPFEVQVAERLRRLGWVVHPQIGVSGFRIDLGIVDPEATGSYLAGVECDGATYHRGATARDRDRLRQHVLETLGWRILRIWSTDWWSNPAREAERLHAELRAALDRARQARDIRDRNEPATAKPADAPAEVPRSVQAAVTDAGPHGRPDAGRFYDEDYRAELGAIVAAALMADGPVREDRLVQTVARLHGFQRAGREIRERVLSVLPPDAISTEEAVGRFVWPPGADPARWRNWRPADRDVARDPADIAIQELVLLAAACQAEGRSQDTVLAAMRDALGMKRLGDTARARCMEALTLAAQSAERRMR